MKIRHKLYLLVSINVVLLLVLVAWGISRLIIMEGEIQRIAHENVPLSESINIMSDTQKVQNLVIERALRKGVLQNLQGGNADPIQEERERFKTRSETISAEMNRAITIAREGLDRFESAEAQAEMQLILTQMPALQEQHRLYEQAAMEMFDLFSVGRQAEAVEKFAAVSKQGSMIEETLEGLMIAFMKFTEQAALTAEKEGADAIWGMAVLAAGIILSGLVLGFWISTGIRRSLQKTNTIMRKIAAEKDLSLRAPEGRDELGEMGANFNQMMDSMAHVVKQVLAASTQLAAAAEELSAVTAQSCSATETQKNETEQVAAAINEMTATMHEVARNVSDAAKAAQVADQEATEHRGVVQNVVQSMESLAEEIYKASQVIERLSTDSESIGSVLDVIRDIAEQTNLLALNAAIEAARAGEQGRGFAVVADEVRTLAQRTQESTNEIQQTIENLQARAREAVAVMHQGGNRASDSLQNVSASNESLEKILNSMTIMRDMTSQIASATEQQTTVSEDINRSISAISDMSHDVSNGTHQIDSAGQEIARLASELQQTVSQFKMIA